MKMIKKNKYTIIAIIIFIVIVILLYQAKQLFFPNEGKAIYGDRLAGKIEIPEETYTGLKALISEKEKVKCLDCGLEENIYDLVVLVGLKDYI